MQIPHIKSVYNVALNLVAVTKVGAIINNLI